MRYANAASVLYQFGAKTTLDKSTKEILRGNAVGGLSQQWKEHLSDPSYYISVAMSLGHAGADWPKATSPTKPVITGRSLKAKAGNLEDAASKARGFNPRSDAPSTSGTAPKPSPLPPHDYEVKPIHGGKFGLFNKDGTPVIERGLKAQRPFDTQEQAAKWLDLADDPAIGRLRPDEAATALRIEKQEAVDLKRYNPPPGGKGDWVDANGVVYDKCSPAPSAQFAREWSNFKDQLTDHLAKVDKVVVDLTDKGLTPAQVKQVMDHIGALSQADKNKVLLFK